MRDMRQEMRHDARDARDGRGDEANTCGTGSHEGSLAEMVKERGKCQG